MLVTVALIVALAAALVVAARILSARWRDAVPIAGWTSAAGHEFEGLSDAERCDLIFAVAALGDEASVNLLERALDDPSEPVALAAARSLCALGRSATLQRYLAARPGERTRRIADAVELLS